MEQNSGGFVYVLSNVCMPGFVKVGATTKHPRERAASLQTTGVPWPFDIEFAAYCRHPYDIEGAVHETLQDHRFASNREFFRVSPGTAIEAVLACLGSNNGEFTCVSWHQCLDPNEVKYYASIFGGIEFDVTQVISFFTEEQWRQAYAKLEERRAERQAARQLEMARIG